MNNKEEFKSWAIKNFTEKSGAGSSYVLSIDWLSDRFFEKGRIKNKSIFEIEDIDQISALHTEVKEIQKNKDSFIYNKDAPSYGEKGFFSASLNKYKEFLQLKNRGSFVEKVQMKKVAANANFDLNSFNKDVIDSGLVFSEKLINRFVSSLLTKPFVILTGLSGSGKTKLAQAFVKWICEDDTQFRIVPVGADWTNRESLLGYPNALDPLEYVKPDSGVLGLIELAAKSGNQDKPYFLILDEMNLSHVERYFADFLSAMESKEAIALYDENTVKNGAPSKLIITPNLFIIGTVNIDETTNMFSPKVLDRANTIEFKVTQQEMHHFLLNIRDINMEALTGKGAGMAKSFLDMAANKAFTNSDLAFIQQELILFFGELKKVGAEFGYRSATEIIRLINQLGLLDSKITINEKLDIAIIQKLLPKLHGSRRKLCPVLETLGGFCLDSKTNIIKEVFEKDNFKYSDEKFPLSLEKIARMYKGAVDNGFTSFAEA